MICLVFLFIFLFPYSFFYYPTLLLACQYFTKKQTKCCEKQTKKGRENAPHTLHLTMIITQVKGFVKPQKIFLKKFKKPIDKSKICGTMQLNTGGKR